MSCSCELSCELSFKLLLYIQVLSCVLKLTVGIQVTYSYLVL